MLHIVDNSGYIIAQMLDGSDTSWYEQNGFIIVEAKDFVNPDEYMYINDKLSPIPDDVKLARAKIKALENLREIVNSFVERKPDGKIRYDTTLKLNLTRAVLNALMNGVAVPDPVLKVEDWINTVQAEYFNLKSQIEAATSISEIPKITYDYFEERYGVNGTVKPDPDVYTSDIV